MNPYLDPRVDLAFKRVSRLDAARVETTLLEDAKAEGEARGAQRTLANMIRRMSAKGMTPQAISELLETPLADVLRALDV